VLFFIQAIGNRGAVAWVLAALVLGFSSVAGQAQEAPPARAQPLSAVELHKLYRDKTWTWENGAARFIDDGRKFLAWVSGDKGEYYGEGRFTLSNAGRMCLSGKWTDSDGTETGSTCFLHRKDGETIYQKREGEGDWYIFKHAPVQPTDEVNKLKEEDTVTDRVAEIKRKLGG
jgi:hypothetical protein